MRHIIRLTETDLTKLIKNVILEMEKKPSYDDYQDAINIIRGRYKHGKLSDKELSEFERIKNGDEDILKKLEAESWGGGYSHAIEIIREYTKYKKINTEVSDANKKPISLYKVGNKKFSKFKEDSDKKYNLIVINPKFKKWNSPDDEITQEDIEDAKKDKKDGVILYRAKNKSGEDKEIFSVAVFSNNQIEEIDG